MEEKEMELLRDTVNSSNGSKRCLSCYCPIGLHSAAGCSKCRCELNCELAVRCQEVTRSCTQCKFIRKVILKEPVELYVRGTAVDHLLNAKAGEVYLLCSKGYWGGAVQSKVLAEGKKGKIGRPKSVDNLKHRLLTINATECADFDRRSLSVPINSVRVRMPRRKKPKGNTSNSARAGAGTVKYEDGSGDKESWTDALSWNKFMKANL